MAKFDELLEQTYQTLGETYGGTSVVPGKDQKADAAKIAAVAAAAASGDKKSEGELEEIGKEIDSDDIKTS